MGADFFPRDPSLFISVHAVLCVCVQNPSDKAVQKVSKVRQKKKAAKFVARHFLVKKEEREREGAEKSLD